MVKAVDRLSYVLECLDDQVDGGKVAVYRHWRYIRPAEYHCPRESKVCLCPGAAVEVCCDGAWSQGVVRRVVREDFEYEVSVDGEKADQLLTKAVYQLRPLYMWNGKRWTHGQQASLSATPPSAQVTDTLAVNVPDTLPGNQLTPSILAPEQFSISIF